MGRQNHYTQNHEEAQRSNTEPLEPTRRGSRAERGASHGEEERKTE